MIIKFLPHGQGDPFRAAAYVMDDKDHLNIPRVGVEVLRGDPITFASIAQSSPHKHRYTSVVIAWAAEDHLDDAKINEVLDEFEVHAFPGLKPYQYHMTAVLHEEENRSKHLHILIPRIELTTGKSLNIAPPGHRHHFDPLRDYFNYKYRWARPDDPARARSVQLQDHALKQNAAALKANLTQQPKETRIELINRFIEHRMLQGMVYDRPTVVQALSEIGIITRIGQNYISLRTDAGTDRLKAAYYDKQFYLSDYLENRSREAAARSASAPDPGTLEQWDRAMREAEQRLREFRQRRQHYNQQTYREPEQQPATIEFNADPDRGFKPASVSAHTLHRDSGRTDPSAAQSSVSTRRTDTADSANRDRYPATNGESRPYRFITTEDTRITSEAQSARTAVSIQSPSSLRSANLSLSKAEYLFTLIGELSANQQHGSHLHPDQRYLNAPVPYRITALNPGKNSNTGERESISAQPLARDEGRDDRSLDHHRIATEISAQIAAIERKLRERTQRQGTTDPEVPDLFIGKHRTSRARKLVQSIGAIVGKVSGFLSRLGFIPRTDRAADRSKTREIFEQFRTVTGNQLVGVIVSRKKYRAQVRYSLERRHEFNERFKGVNSFISEVLDWSKKRVFPEKTLDSFIDKIHEHQPKDRQFVFVAPRIHAENTDKKLRQQLKSLINNQEQYGLHFPFVSDFKQCISGLRSTMHLLEKNDYPHIYGFLTTMDRYMQMIQLNYKHVEIDQAHRKMKGEVEGTIEEFKIKLEQSEIEKGFKVAPRVTTSKNELPKQDLVIELVPEKPKIKPDNSRDFEM